MPIPPPTTWLHVLNPYYQYLLCTFDKTHFVVRVGGLDAGAAGACCDSRAANPQSATQDLYNVEGIYDAMANPSATIYKKVGGAARMTFHLAIQLSPPNEQVRIVEMGHRVHFVQHLVGSVSLSAKAILQSVYHVGCQ